MTADWRRFPGFFHECRGLTLQKIYGTIFLARQMQGLNFQSQLAASVGIDDN